MFRESLVSRQEVNWDYRRPGFLTKSVPVTVFENSSQVNAPADSLPTILVPGYGSGKRATRKVIDWLGDQGVHAIGVVLPLNQVPAERHAVQAVSKEVIHTVGDVSKEQRGLSTSTPMDALCDSQGGGAWLDSRSERSEGLGDAALIQPVGLRDPNLLIGKTEAQLRHDFLRRFSKDALKQPKGEVEAFFIGGNVLGQFMFDATTRRLKEKLNYALSKCFSGEIVDHIKKGNRVALITSEGDGVFPIAEIRQSLSDYHESIRPEVILLPGLPHATLTTEPGQKLLKAGIDFLAV